MLEHLVAILAIGVLMFLVGAAAGFVLGMWASKTALDEALHTEKHPELREVITTALRERNDPHAEAD